MRLQDAEAVANGDSGGNDQEAPGKTAAVGAANRIDGLPGDQHGHDGGFAGTGSEFQAESPKVRVGVKVGFVEMVQKALTGVAQFGGDFGEPDDGFDGLHLAEEWPDAVKGVVTPVLKQARRFRSYLPIVGVGRAPPLIHLHAEVVDQAGLGVLLLIAGETFVQSEGLLLRLLFLRPGDGGDELGETTTLDDALGGLAFGVQFPNVWREARMGC